MALHLTFVLIRLTQDELMLIQMDVFPINWIQMAMVFLTLLISVRANPRGMTGILMVARFVRRIPMIKPHS